MAKYSSLEELRRKKALLKNEVQEMESLLKFENTKESLSAFTDGFTDKFLLTEPSEDGKLKTVLNKKEITKEITNNVKNKMVNKNSMMNMANFATEQGLVESAIRLGATTLIGNFAKKNMKSNNWKKKLIGIGLLVLAPIILKMVRKKLDEYQKNKSVSSMEKLI